MIQFARIISKIYRLDMNVVCNTQEKRGSCGKVAYNYLNLIKKLIESL